MDLLKKLKFLDSFGVPIQVTFKSERQYRSQFGAAVSIAVYSLSVIYAIYIFEEWINSKILPKVQSQDHSLKYAALSLGDGAITIGYFNDTTIDPFSRNGNILTPVLMKLNNTNLEFVGAYFSELRSVSYAEGLRPTVSFPNMDLTLTKGESFKVGVNNEISYMLMIVVCDEKYIIGTNGSCASQEKIQDFLNTTVSRLDFNVNLQQYNIQSQQFETIQKSLYFSIQNQN